MKRSQDKDKKNTLRSFIFRHLERQKTIAEVKLLKELKVEELVPLKSTS